MSARPLVVVTNRCFPDTLAALGAVAVADVDANDAVEPWSYAEVMRRSRNAAALLAFMTDRVDADLLAACPKLRVVGAALKGYDNIDVDAATAAGVWITIVPDLLTVPTAELAIGLMLGLGRNVLVGDRRVREHGFQGWRPNLYGTGIAGETVGIVGFGRVGQAIAQRLIGFECRLLAYDMSKVQPSAELARHIRQISFEELLAESDYVILALPLSPATRHMFDADVIGRMRKGAYLVNPARGSLVDEAAVGDAIMSGQLAGYAADVFECEDWAQPGRPAMVEHRLTDLSAQTILTPHIGSAVADVRRAIELSAAASIIDVLSGKTPRYAVNKRVT